MISNLVFIYFDKSDDHINQLPLLYKICVQSSKLPVVYYKCNLFDWDYCKNGIHVYVTLAYAHRLIMSVFYSPY